MYHLTNWSTALDPRASPYTPPEARDTVLRGNVWHHPSYKQGDYITTSGIKSVEGRRVVTRSGSIYWLLDPDPKFVEYLDMIGFDFDPESPIRAIRATGLTVNDL